MAQEFKEVAHLKTDMKKFGEGMERIKRFEEFKKKILAVESGIHHNNTIKVILQEVTKELGVDAANKMVEILELPFESKEDWD